MSELEEWALEAENRSQQDFLSAHLAVLHAMLHHPSKKIYIPPTISY